MMPHESILHAIQDADDAVSQWPDDEHGISIEVPIDALRWLVHAASMYWTNQDRSMTNDLAAFYLAQEERR